MTSEPSVRPVQPELSLLSTVDELDDVDVLVVGLGTGPSLIGPLGWEGDLLAELTAVGATGKTDELARVPGRGGYRSVLTVGLGDVSEDATGERVRRAAGVAARALAGTARAATTLSGVDLAAAAEGFGLGAYSFGAYLSDPGPAPVGAVQLVSSEADGAAVLAHAVAVSRAVVATRELVNTPPNDLFPASFAERARRLGADAGLAVDILDETALARDGYGGILGVGQGSARPPRLVRMTYSGGGARTVSLVGKGITFDTGGISIKPAAGMEAMTLDMAGAAAVVSTVVAAAELALPLTVIATVPMAENMPSGTAQRPGDVLRQYGGRTVEVINTDAEGRLVLADAIVRAGEDAPDYLIDTATLTGAQMVALGERTPGVMGTDEFRDRVARISQAVGENGWAMPLPTELRAELDSRVADLANVTNKRFGGMLAAAIFLREFVPEGLPWAHVDVAGPAFSDSVHGYTGLGGTGVPVRTLIAVLEDIAAHG